MSGTQEVVAHSRQRHIDTLKLSAAYIREVSKMLKDPRAREENEAHARRIDDMIAVIEENAIVEHAKGRA